MKTKLIIISAVTLMVSACTTGTRLTKTYDDDIYFSPGDVPPVAVVTDQAQVKDKPAKSNNGDAKDKRIVMSQLERNADGTSTVNNSIYQQDQQNNNADYQSYTMDNQELVSSDTTRYYNDDDVKTVINNYYDSDDVDYAYRIRRFHSPFYYSPFYDDWYYGYSSPWYSGYYGWDWGWNYGWGYDPWYSCGWGYPYSYGYYSPFAFGAGLWGLGGWYGGWYGGYYNGYNGWYGGGFHQNYDVARRRDTNLSLPGGRGSLYGGSVSGMSSGHRPGSVVAGSGSDLKNATIVNDRRPSTSTNGRQMVNSPGREISSQIPRNGANGAIRRTYEPSTTSRTYDQNRAVRQNYTPSYNKPRIVNQSNYNSYSRPRTSSSGSYNSGYSEPRSSSTMRQTYRSSSSYSNGSSSSGYNRSSSSGSYNRSSSYSSSPSYSAPSRSSSSGSYSGSYSGGSSSGSSSHSSGGGGGSGHRR